MDTNRLFLFSGGPPSQHKEAVIAYIERCDFGAGGKADITVRGVERTVIEEVCASTLGLAQPEGQSTCLDKNWQARFLASCAYISDEKQISCVHVSFTGIKNCMYIYELQDPSC